MTRIPMKSTYDNDLDLDTVRLVIQYLHKAWEIAAEGGTNVAVKHGDNDESDAISSLLSGIRMKYQGRATFKQRSTWE